MILDDEEMEVNKNFRVQKQKKKLSRGLLFFHKLWLTQPETFFLMKCKSTTANSWEFSNGNISLRTSFEKLHILWILQSLWAPLKKCNFKVDKMSFNVWKMKSRIWMWLWMRGNQYWILHLGFPCVLTLDSQDMFTHIGNWI